MKKHDFFWLVFDIFIFLLLISFFDANRYFLYASFLVFKIFLHFFAVYFERHLSKGFCDVHRINFRNSEWWIFVFWFTLATYFDWLSH